MPREFFARPLWEVTPGGAPKKWEDLVDDWTRRVGEVGLSDMAERYAKILRGEWLTDEELIGVIDRWNRKYGESDDQSTESVADTDDEAERGEGDEAGGVETEPGPGVGLGRATALGEAPAEEDRLGREPLVRSLAAMIADEEQGTPFTVALLGDWGSGKSSVMNLVGKRLVKEHPGRFDFAWFNAWKYEHTENMEAALAQEVVQGLVQETTWHERWRLRLNFANSEYGLTMSRTLLYLTLIALPLAAFGGAAWLASGHQLLQSVLGVGAAAGAVVFGVHAYQGIKRVVEHPLAVELKTYLKLPSYGEHMGLIPMLKRHLRTLCGLRLGPRKRQGQRRLVVFVDDLDRCQPGCIARTLDAIRLVMDIPNVITVIGIDHRIALRAMQEQYKALADAQRCGDRAGLPGQDRAVADPSGQT